MSLVEAATLSQQLRWAGRKAVGSGALMRRRNGVVKI
jgi:hypothetical protein